MVFLILFFCVAQVLNALRWQCIWCGDARFVLKTDDDVFVAVPHLLDLLRERVGDLQPDTVFGAINSKSIVLRGEGHWTVDALHYPLPCVHSFCSLSSLHFTFTFSQF